MLVEEKSATRHLVSEALKQVEHASDNIVRLLERAGVP